MKPSTPNRAFRAAYCKGFAQGYAGNAKHNPYPDRKTDRGSVTFSRAFRKYWEEGYRNGAESRKQMVK